MNKILLKKVEKALQVASATYPRQNIQLWVQDEGRIGLKPFTSRQWSPIGDRPIAIQHHGYQWLYVYIFVQPSTGHTEFIFLPKVNDQMMQSALDTFQF